MNTAQPGSVVICGAGPGGATLALTLARRGVRVSLLERHGDFDREFRGEWLNQSGRLALEQMGLGDALKRVPTLTPGGATVFIGGTERFTMRPGDTKASVDHLLVPQPALLREVITEASKFPNFSFHKETVVRDVVRKNGRVVGVSGTHNGEPVEYLADFVVATDGRASVLRRASGLTKSVDNGGGFDMLWFKASLPPRLDATLGYQFLQRGGTAFTHPHPDGLHQYGWAFTKGTYGELRKEGRTAWVEAMKNHVPEPFATHLDTVKNNVDAAFLEIVSSHLLEWSVPGLLLIGDAAHPMSAVGGQGINMALRDAVVAANHIGPLLRDGRTDPAALDAAAAKVGPERLPEISKIQKMQEKGSQILNLQTKPARFMMEKIVPLLGKKAGPILARGVGTTKAFSVGVTKVNLEF
jgi:2-polyprenyl-6-methoxyphenol hydroxylase-like FAD-dependent oxidoreductase